MHTARRAVVIAVAFIALCSAASAEQRRTFPGTFHAARSDALICFRADVLFRNGASEDLVLRLLAPDARETLGELSFTRLAEFGDCWPAGARDLKICGGESGAGVFKNVSNVYPFAKGRPSVCGMMRNRDLVDEKGVVFDP
jgi:hypothetical protein